MLWDYHLDASQLWAGHWRQLTEHQGVTNIWHQWPAGPPPGCSRPGGCLYLPRRGGPFCSCCQHLITCRPAWHPDDTLHRSWTRACTKVVPAEALWWFLFNLAPICIGEEWKASCVYWTCWIVIIPNLICWSNVLYLLRYLDNCQFNHFLTHSWHILLHRTVSMSPGSAVNKAMWQLEFHWAVTGEGGTCQSLSVKRVLMSRKFPVTDQLGPPLVCGPRTLHTKQPNHIQWLLFN